MTKLEKTRSMYRVSIKGRKCAKPFFLNHFCAISLTGKVNLCVLIRMMKNKDGKLCIFILFW